MVNVKDTNTCLLEFEVTIMGVDILAAVKKFQIQCYPVLLKLLEDTGLCAKNSFNLCGSVLVWIFQSMITVL